MKALRMFGSIAVSSMLALGFAACGDDNPSTTGASVVSTGELKDSRDGKVYKTVKIGAQTWMAENLSYKTADSKCSSNDSDCKNGRLYHWADAMDLGFAANTTSSALVIKSVHQGLCPDGFHVPSKGDYGKLFSQPWIDGVFENNGIEYPTNVESLVFASDEECEFLLKANPDDFKCPEGYICKPFTYKESDLERCNLYKFNGSIVKDGKSNVSYWTALEGEDENMALAASLLNAKSGLGSKNRYNTKSDGNYLRCVSDEELCGGKELESNQFCYNEKAYNKVDESELHLTYYSIADENGMTAYSVTDYYEEGGKLYRLCGGKKLADGMFCVAGKAYEKCNGREFDVITEFCSYGTIYSRDCGDKLLDDTQFCVEGVAYNKCGGEGYDVTEEKCINNVVNRMCGTSYYPRDKQFCVEEIVYDKCGGEEYDVTQDVCVDGKVNRPCGDTYYVLNDNKRCVDGAVKELIMGTLKDSRDGQIYRTVTIGTQTWMAENLNYQIGESKCYGDKPENCEKYGHLYTWDDAEKACPAGWRLPSEAEFESLLAAAGSSQDKRSQNLRAGSWKNGSDKFGFSALPAGFYHSDSKLFNYLGTGAEFWTSTEHTSVSAYYLFVGGNGLAYVHHAFRDDGLSVRCLQDN